MSTVAIREKPKPGFSALSTGLALYSMFFGAGNVVFPLILGRASGENYLLALLGITLSGVLFPFIGLIAMLFCKGDLKQFLGRLGPWPAKITLFILNLSLGLFIVSRLFTLMHVSLQVFLPDLSLEIFSGLACVLVFFLTYKPHRLVTLLGTILTPILLLVLAILVFSGLSNAPAAPHLSGTPTSFFMTGLKCGYQMIDLISALLFAALIVPPLLAKEGNNEQLTFKKLFQASSIAALLLLITYFGLTWIAAHYSLSSTIPSEGLLNALSFEILGPYGSLISSSIIFLACLTTAMSCSSIFAQYLRTEVCQDRISPNASLWLSLILAAFLATLGFAGIMRLLTPIIEVLYPALIVLCILTIGNHFFQIKPTKAPVYFMLGFAAGMMSFS